MRVLQLISSNGFYGAEGVMASLASGLSSLGCKVDICLFDLKKMPARDLERLHDVSGVPIRDLRCTTGFDLRALLRLVDMIRDIDAEVIHCHGYKSDIYGVLAAHIVGCKVIATCHNWSNRSSSLRRSMAVDLRFLRHFDSVVAVSENVASILRNAGLPISKLRRINNGIDIRSYDFNTSPLHNESSPVLGVVSRLAEEKGIDVLIRALPRILEIHPTLMCRVVGDGPERDKLLDLAASLDITQHLRLEGFCSNTRKFLKTCTVIALPSRTEGMPLALLEAMASGRPVVASCVGSIPDLLLDGAAGILVPPDNPEALADGILHVLSESDLRKQITEMASEHVRLHFDASLMARSYYDTYRELVCLPADIPAAPC